ncbi:hypothetical protein PLEOSDRAFT_157857 [Pleurotus ostreatus PC15]|uniref:Cytochrome P450 n=1 Tax=Pleurotus ostreatus (strain PC15) TaxID=1137138 RepID=A0A067NXE8_PLEO1|nr:hypothetical protein PLEOSDRAFT_157857 [Pleurotus ostreatus PC15]
MAVGLAYYFLRNQCLPLPPGPPCAPIIGHLRSLPQDDQAELVYHEWAKKYGDVIRVTTLGRRIIILGSQQAATDLLEKRSGIYSDRTETPVYEIMGWGVNLAFTRYSSPRFRKLKKMLQQNLSQRACVQFQQIQTENAHILVNDLLNNKGDYFYLVGRYATAISMRIAYGHQICSDDDEFIRISMEGANSFLVGGTPGTTMIDLFPILRYFPTWFPGTHYAEAARLWKPVVDRMHGHPYNTVRNRMAQGTARPSLLASELQRWGEQELSDEDVSVLKGFAGAIHSGGTETTSAGLALFSMAMILHPECQKRGQEEIDLVVGKDRLPTFADKDSLPYVTCIMEEILRWHPSLPLGVAHRSTEDDIYRGMFIPKGSVLIANIRGISLDENVYKNPTEFNPSRFLPTSAGGNGEPVFNTVFGFGRRMCPGKYLAPASLWIAVATMLSTLHITKAKDEQGNEIVPLMEFDRGVVSHIKHFPCDVSVRSENARKLISNAVENIDV